MNSNAATMRSTLSRCGVRRERDVFMAIWCLIDWRSIMYSRDEIKALLDKVLNMARADAVELTFEGGERAGTRFANSTITTNLVQYDQQLTVTVRHGQKQAQRVDARTGRRVAEGGGGRGAGGGAESARQPEPRAAREGSAGVRAGRRRRAGDRGLRSGRARRVGQAVDRHLREEGRPRRRLHPQGVPDDLPRELGGAVRVLPVRGDRLHPHLPDGERRRIRDGRASPARRICRR